MPLELCLALPVPQKSSFPSLSAPSLPMVGRMEDMGTSSPAGWRSQDQEFIGENFGVLLWDTFTLAEMDFKGR